MADNNNIRFASFNVALNRSQAGELMQPIGLMILTIPILAILLSILGILMMSHQEISE